MLPQWARRCRREAFSGLMTTNGCTRVGTEGLLRVEVYRQPSVGLGLLGACIVFIHGLLGRWSTWNHRPLFLCRSTKSNNVREVLEVVWTKSSILSRRDRWGVKKSCDTTRAGIILGCDKRRVDRDGPAGAGTDFSFSGTTRLRYGKWIHTSMGCSVEGHRLPGCMGFSFGG